jgi:sugar phosphate isomerase/epimerase
VCRLLEKADIREIELLGEPAALRSGAVRRVLRVSGISVSALTAASRVSTGRDPASPDAAQRRATVDHYRRCVDVAVSLECPLIGVAPCAVGRHWLIASARDEIAYSLECVRDVALHARSAGLGIGIEVLCRYASSHINTCDQGLQYIEKLHSENVGLILDLFHMNIEETSLPAAILGIRGRIKNVHVADSNRRGIGHGHLDIAAIVRALKCSEYVGPLTFEAFPTRVVGEAVYSAAESQLIRQYLFEFKPRLCAAGWC